MMLGGVVSRDDGDPWPAIHLTSELWLIQPVRRFMIADLVVTQPGVTFAALMSDQLPVGGDLLPHVVIWNEVAYLEDGHTRIVRALIAGSSSIKARYVNAG